MVKKILSALNVLLITIFVFFGVKMFYGIVAAHLEEEILSGEMEKNNAMQHSAVSAGIADISAQRRFSEYESIIHRDLFRTKAVETTAPPLAATDIEELEKTQLKLKLWGTITGDVGGTAYAVIEDISRRGQPQHLYREGDRIGNAGIKLILREKVVLTVDGKDEVLEMEQLFDESARASAPTPPPIDYPPVYGVPAVEEEISITRDTIEDALSDVGNLMRQVRIRPFFKDGNPEGVLLSGIRRGSIFEEMGLNSGDVIKGVNGNPIRTVEDAMKLYEGLKSEQSVQLQIERDGTPQTISYRIN